MQRLARRVALGAEEEKRDVLEGRGIPQRAHRRLHPHEVEQPVRTGDGVRDRREPGTALELLQQHDRKLSEHL